MLARIKKLPMLGGIAMARKFYGWSRSERAPCTLGHGLWFGDATHGNGIRIGIIEFALRFVGGKVRGRFLGRRYFQSARKLVRVGLCPSYEYLSGLTRGGMPTRR